MDKENQTVTISFEKWEVEMLLKVIENTSTSGTASMRAVLHLENKFLESINGSI